ncbi:MAG: alpha/beta hydrolase [Alphaproteobacteria bacterium]
MLQLDQTFMFHDQKVAWGSIGAGDPLILLHGFPWSSQAWRRIAPHLSLKRQVFYFDMVGCGQSEKRDGQDVTANVQNDLLAALIEHWGLSRPQVVGHDFGGLAALRAHFINGVEFGKLYLLDAVSVLPSGSPFFTHVMQHEVAFVGLPSYAHQALFRAYIQNAAHKPLSDEAVKIYLEPWLGKDGQSAFYRQIAQANTKYISELQQKYAKRPFEVHLAWGERDSFIPISQGEELKEKLCADTMTRIPDAGHIVHEDAPEAVVSFLLNH